jgi:hypothetical protein
MTDEQYNRRVTDQLLGYWKSIREQGFMPSFSNVNPENIENASDDSFLLQIDDDAHDHFIYVGENVKEALETGKGSEGISLLERRLQEQALIVNRTGRPMADEAEVDLADKRVIKYRLVLLPVGEDNKITHVLGGMRHLIE